jgi:hypothetical protein
MKSILKQTTDHWPSYALSPDSTNLYTKKYKGVQLIFFFLSGARDWAQCLEHVDECLTAELYPQFNSETYLTTDFA